MSVRDWFLTPAERSAPPDDTAATTWAPPVAGSPAVTAPVDAAPAPAPTAAVASPGTPVEVSQAPVAAAPIASAAVIGRPGEAEPVAAGIALALRGRAPAAAVIVVAEPAAPNAEGGTPAARRLAARLGSHGFPVAARGRLAWVCAEPDAARRAARLAGEPVVLAITVPLDPALELAIADQDVTIVVARDEHGPLARIATASLAGHDVTVTKPLPRGLSRLLARHGLRAPAELRLALRV